MKLNIGITQPNLEKSTIILTNCLADANILYIKLRKFHWNVSGESFMEYHLLFEDQYNLVAEAIDKLAERISKLGAIAIGTTSEFAKLSGLKEAPGKIPKSTDMLKELIADHETIIKSLRKYIDSLQDEIKDTGSADLLTDLLREHETMAWKLRRYF